MPTILKYLENVDSHDKQFLGTIAFRSENMALPNGNKMALGLDDGHWVLVYQESSKAHFKVFNYDQHENKIHLDKKLGNKDTLKEFKKHINYFFSHAKVADLVTLLPPQAQQVAGATE